MAPYDFIMRKKRCKFIKYLNYILDNCSSRFPIGKMAYMIDNWNKTENSLNTSESIADFRHEQPEKCTYLQQ